MGTCLGTACPALVIVLGTPCGLSITAAGLSITAAGLTLQSLLRFSFKRIQSGVGAHPVPGGGGRPALMTVTTHWSPR